MMSLRTLLPLALVAVLPLAGCGQAGPTAPPDEPAPAADAEPDSAEMPSAPDETASAEPPRELSPVAKAAMEGVVVGPDTGGHVPVSDDAGLTPENGDWYVERVTGEPAHLNVLLDTADAYSNQIMRFTFEAMLDRDPETLELTPVLAKSWEESDDHLTYTFYLDERARFADGEPVTAEDVKFSFDAIMNPDNETADARNYFESITGCEILDEHTVQFTCSKPYFKHLVMIGGNITVLPKHIYGVGDFNTHPANRAPVGSGPYMFESWETNQRVTMKRNPNYWREDGQGYVDKMVTLFITEDTVAFQGLKSHDFDMMEFLPEIWVSQTSAPEFRAEFYRTTQEGRSGYAGSYNYIAWNLRNPKFADKRVRQALTMLLPRQLIVDEIFYGLARVHTGPAAYQEDGYDKTIQPWPFDPEAAKKKLDEAGWIDTNGDGIRDKDGITFDYEFMFPPGIPEYEQLATVYKEELEAAGIRMNIRLIEWAAMVEQITKRDFDSVTLSWAVPLEQDPFQVWHSTMAEQGSNYPGFVNAESDRLLEAARLEFDKEKRDAIYREFHALVHEEQPYTFVLSRPRLIAIDNRFHGVNVYALGLLPNEWWVKTDQRRH